MEVSLTSLSRILNGMPHLVVLLIGLWLAKLFFKVTVSFRFNDELTEKDNPAFGIYLGGYLLGVGIALMGALYHAGHSLMEDMLNALFGIMVTTVLMRLSVWINDKLILYKFSVLKEISQDRNMGTGFVVAGSCIATGLMINGMLSGPSHSWLTAVCDVAIYWSVGQLLLILGGFMFQWSSGYDAHQVIEEDDNIPAGISFGGFLAAIGIITRSALVGATSNLTEELIITVIFALSGMLLLVPTHTIVDKILLPASPIVKEVKVDKNPAAGVMAAVSFLIVAFIFIAAVNPH